MYIYKYKPLICANFKMHGTLNIFSSFLSDISSEFTNINIDLIIFSSYISLPFTRFFFNNRDVKWGGQDFSLKRAGAFTGETSTLMLKDIGCSYVIIGHSERRKEFSESNEVVRNKVLLALESNLIPIVCIGESLKDYKDGYTKNVLKYQLKASLPVECNSNIIIAYEPIWAIGSGYFPTVKEIYDVHCFLKDCLIDLYGLDHFPLLYGGSITSKNINTFLNIKNVDGVLIGSSTLNSVCFLDIIRNIKLIV